MAKESEDVCQKACNGCQRRPAGDPQTRDPQTRGSLVLGVNRKVRVR